MPKIEGWEKVEKNKWKHKELGLVVLLDIDNVGDNYWVTRTFVIKGLRGGIKGMREKVLKKVKGKSSAQEFAIEYMKKCSKGKFREW